MSPIVIKTLLVALGSALVAVANAGLFPSWTAVLNVAGGVLLGAPVNAPGTAAKIEAASK